MAAIDPAIIDRLSVVLEAALIFAVTVMFLRICDLTVQIERDRRARRREQRRYQRLASREAWAAVDEISRSPW